MNKIQKVERNIKLADAWIANRPGYKIKRAFKDRREAIDFGIDLIGGISEVTDTLKKEDGSIKYGTKTTFVEIIPIFII